MRGQVAALFDAIILLGRLVGADGSSPETSSPKTTPYGGDPSTSVPAPL